MKKNNESISSTTDNSEQNLEENIIHIPAQGTFSSSTQARNERRFSNIELLIYSVLFIALISLVGIVVAVTTLVIDQMHFNNETYREESTNFQTQVELLRTEINTLKK